MNIQEKMNWTDISLRGVIIGIMKEIIIFIQITR